MKQLTCEMCGSTDLVKQNGLYICQSCGTKYSVEEAKKMMVEGTVEIQGTVEVTGTVQMDTSTEIDNLYQIARRARDEDNEQNAAKYYDMIKMKDPTSWEASFYQVYFSAMLCKIAQIKNAAMAMSNCQKTVLTMVKEHVQDLNDKAAIIQEIIERNKCIAILLYENSKSWWEKSDMSFSEHQSNTLEIYNILYTCGDEIERIFAEEPMLVSMAAIAWKYGVELSVKWLGSVGGDYDSVLESYDEKIRKYDANYTYVKNFLYEKYADMARGLEVKRMDIINDKNLYYSIPTVFSGLIWIVSLLTDDTLMDVLGSVCLILGIFCGVIWYKMKQEAGEMQKILSTEICEAKRKRDSYK